MDIDLKGLFAKLNPYCYAALDAAAAAAVGRGASEIGVDDLLLALSEGVDADLPKILRAYQVDLGEFRAAVQRELEANPKRGDKPVFGRLLVDLLQEAWSLASLTLGAERVRSAHLLLALRGQPRWYRLAAYADLLDTLPEAELSGRLDELLAGSVESVASGVAAPVAGGDSAIERFTTDLTAKAEEGRLDPVFCRDREIRSLIDILARRQKNNPILVGDPGVGKSAVVEGLALRIHAGEVPQALKGARVLVLDLGLLQAGASVKGEFEKRLSKLIQEVKAAPHPVVLFIDEAHTLIGAGGAAGGGDAANLLKPALARGELRAVAATTWSEYKKYFEKDPALARRFQLVRLDEPSVTDAVTILRGLRGVYEKAHGVYIRDDAIQAAATLAARYITGRQLPDKAVDVLDTACARINIALSAKPPELEDLEQAIAVAERHRAAADRDLDMGIGEAAERARLDTEIAELEAKAAQVTKRWDEERATVERLLALRQGLDGLKGKKLATARKDIETARAKLADAGGLVPYEVTPEVVSKVIADWTGVPLGKLVRDEAAVLLDFSAQMRRYVKGQPFAAERIGERIRAAKSGLGNPDAPIGVFLLVGPSGVGKTETAIATAELLFGGKQALTVINMSEFQERHTISRLIGSPPGYVGYGEGGKLTEAVRQRPYSVVLLDEIEKADLEVLNLFYQVFDKGVLSDGEGREIDFRNTVIFLTSNLGTDETMRAWEQNPEVDAGALAERLRPLLSKHLKPALLARMEVVPYRPLGREVLREIIEAKLSKLATRLLANRGVALSHGPELVDFIAARCTVADAGARDIEAVINRFVLPDMAGMLIAGWESPEPVAAIQVGVEGERVRVSLLPSSAPTAIASTTTT